MINMQHTFPKNKRAVSDSPGAMSDGKSNQIRHLYVSVESNNRKGSFVQLKNSQAMSPLRISRAYMIQKKEMEEQEQRSSERKRIKQQTLIKALAEEQRLSFSSFDRREKLNFINPILTNQMTSPTNMNAEAMISNLEI